VHTKTEKAYQARLIASCGIRDWAPLTRVPFWAVLWQVELKPGGGKVEVTEANKLEVGGGWAEARSRLCNGLIL
jgi:hypothetical protein